MRVCTLSSGSSGNSIFVQSDKAKILVDCGLNGRQTIELLEKIGVNPADIDAILVTHEHVDHIKGVGILSRKFNIPIIANEKTWSVMSGSIGKISDDNRLAFKTNSFFRFKDMDIQNMSTYHDAIDPVFFMFYQGKQKITILTDTGCVTPQIVDSIKGSDVYILESNHDVEMLEYGPYPYNLKVRIKSDHGHLSNDACAEILSEIVKGEGEQIILGHLSTTNNTPISAFENAKKVIENLGYNLNENIFLDVAREYQVGKLIDLGGEYEYWYNLCWKY